MRGMKHEDNSFSPDDARAGCRIGAAEANYGLRAGQRTQNVLRSPRKREANEIYLPNFASSPIRSSASIQTEIDADRKLPLDG